ncbi:putative 60S ribosomal export protein NMD3 [Ochromonadaceae sp. CCMP2298]|nr:putative 60S ribosomal export protein NMD3 [Ochromonadaceae sp. CCMP2298]
MSAMAMTAGHPSTLPLMLCCVCGITIEQNAANMCISCVRNTVDITAEISKKCTIHSCRSCQRWLAPPWQAMNLESKELMTVCLRKVTGLSKVKLIDAVWIWTEPHSLRLKIKLTVQREVVNNAVLQQAAVVEFIIRNQQCKACEASYAQGNWHAVVQVRQRVDHKRTFFYLEQLILKHESHMECIKIESFKDGMDFYFQSKNQALRFIEFLSSNVPHKTKYSRKLVSADSGLAIGNFKHNYLVEMATLCKDDLLIMPKELANNLSNISRMVLVKRIAAGIHVIDPLTGERAEINCEKYWRNPFKSVMNSRQLARYVVLAVEPILVTARPSSKMGRKGKTRLAEVTVARERDLGTNDTQFVCVSHLGHILKAGDVVLGYDFTCTNWNVDDEDTDKVLKSISRPDLVLVRKFFEAKRARQWSLKKLNAEEGDEKGRSAAEERVHEVEYEAFLQDMEQDREMRSKINLYRKGEMEVEEGEGEGRGLEEGVAMGGQGEKGGGGLDEDEVRLEELLDDMGLDPDEEDEEEGP